jgi:DNA-binding FadR family transcriptional regulator
MLGCGGFRGNCGATFETKRSIAKLIIICILFCVTGKINWSADTSLTLTRPGLHHELADRIGSLIAQGALKPGTVLPNEKTLGEEFGVSRTALREAIKVLASKGLVEVRRKTGTRVHPPEEWNMLDPEVLGWLFSGSGVPPALADLMDVRKVVEPAAARMAAQRATAKDVAEIREAWLGMEQATGDVPTSVEADLRFHLAVLEATHNVFMRPFGALIQAALRASFRLTNSNPALYRKSLINHRLVLEAVEVRNGDEAESAMVAMLRQTAMDIATQIRTSKQAASTKKKRRGK